MQLSHVTACRSRAAVAFLLEKRVPGRPSHPRAILVTRETVRASPLPPPPHDLRLPTDVVESRSCVLPRPGHGRYAKHGGPGNPDCPSLALPLPREGERAG